MANIQVIYPGATEVKEFPGLLEAFEHIVARGKQRNFMIKQSENSPWEDGAELFQGMQKMFEPVGS